MCLLGAALHRANGHNRHFVGADVLISVLIVHWTRTIGGMSLLSLHSRLYGREH
jgi:hypothetical protein